MKDYSEIVNYDGWPVWQRRPGLEGWHPLLMMLHGWSGDETSMSIFSSRIPEDYFIISPRGIFPAPFGGYSWTRNGQGSETVSMEDFSESIDRLNQLISPDKFPGVDMNNINLMGFSQGAALAFSLAISIPERINRVAGLSGFLPYDLGKFRTEKPLENKRVFLAHGLKDELIPVENARLAVSTLESLGARVIYCEDDIGHKISPDCFRGLGQYFRTRDEM